MSNVIAARAAAFAAHAGHMDRDGRPHMDHVERVVAGAMELAEMHAPGEVHLVAQIAWLHDVVEDNEAITVEYLRNITGEGWVLAAVRLLTRDEKSLMGTYAEYIDRMTEDESWAAKLALIVKVADLADNLRRCRAEGNTSLGRRYEKALDLVAGELMRRA